MSMTKSRQLKFELTEALCSRGVTHANSYSTVYTYIASATKLGSYREFPAAGGEAIRLSLNKY